MFERQKVGKSTVKGLESMAPYGVKVSWDRGGNTVIVSKVVDCEMTVIPEKNTLLNRALSEDLKKSLEENEVGFTLVYYEGEPKDSHLARLKIELGFVGWASNLGGMKKTIDWLGKLQRLEMKSSLGTNEQSFAPLLRSSITL